MRAARDVIEQYRDAFNRADVDALLACYGFPLQVVSISGGEASVSVFSDEEWSEAIERLLGAYQRLGVRDCVPRDLEVRVPLAGVANVRVAWALRRQDGTALYDFGAVYTLVPLGGATRIVSITHDEVSQMQAASRDR